MDTLQIWVNGFMVQIGLIIACYILALAAVLLDLKSGIRKAKLRGEFRRSFGFRQTFRKFNEYGNSLMLLTVLDLMQMIFLKALNGQLTVSLPVIPLATFVGCAGVAIVEYRSIKENAEDKTRIEEVEAVAAQLVRELAKNQQLFNQVQVLLKHNNNEQGITQQQSGQYPDLGGDIQRGGDTLDGPGL